MAYDTKRSTMKIKGNKKMLIKQKEKRVTVDKYRWYKCIHLTVFGCGN